MQWMVKVTCPCGWGPPASTNTTSEFGEDEIRSAALDVARDHKDGSKDPGCDPFVEVMHVETFRP